MWKSNVHVSDELKTTCNKGISIYNSVSGLKIEGLFYRLNTAPPGETCSSPQRWWKLMKGSHGAINHIITCISILSSLIVYHVLSACEDCRWSVCVGYNIDKQLLAVPIVFPSCLLVLGKYKTQTQTMGLYRLVKLVTSLPFSGDTFVPGWGEILGWHCSCCCLQL